MSPWLYIMALVAVWTAHGIGVYRDRCRLQRSLRRWDDVALPATVEYTHADAAWFRSYRGGAS